MDAGSHRGASRSSSNAAALVLTGVTMNPMHALVAVTVNTDAEPAAASTAAAIVGTEHSDAGQATAGPAGAGPDMNDAAVSAPADSLQGAHPPTKRGRCSNVDRRAFRAIAVRIVVRLCMLAIIITVLRVYPSEIKSAGQAYLDWIQGLGTAGGPVVFLVTATAFTAISPTGYLPSIVAGATWADRDTGPGSIGIGIILSYLCTVLGAGLNIVMVRTCLKGNRLLQKRFGGTVTAPAAAAVPPDANSSPSTASTAEAAGRKLEGDDSSSITLSTTSLQVTPVPTSDGAIPAIDSTTVITDPPSSSPSGGGHLTFHQSSSSPMPLLPSSIRDTNTGAPSSPSSASLSTNPSPLPPSSNPHSVAAASPAPRRRGAFAWIEGLEGALLKHPIRMVILLRLPFLSNGAMNYILSYSPIPWLPMMIGNIIGMMPGSVLFAVGGSQVRSVAQLIANGPESAPAAIGIFVGIVCVLIFSIITVIAVARRFAAKERAAAAAARTAAAATAPQ